MCSNLFPDHCNLTPNSIYKSSSTGAPELVFTCDGDKAFITVSDGSVGVGKDCKCPDEGITCGEVFPLICRIPATTLHKCTKGDDPIEDKSCFPGLCVASAATILTSHHDTCIGDCECSDTGSVSVKF